MTNHPRVALGQVLVGDGLGTTHPVVAVDAGNGRANCVTLDKGWCFLRKWEEVEVEHEFVAYSPEFPQEQVGWRAVLRQIAEAQSLADRWEEQYLDEEARRVGLSKRVEDLQKNISSHYQHLYEDVLPRMDQLKEENDLLRQRVKDLEGNPPYAHPGFGGHHNPAVLVLEDKDIEDVEVKSIDDGRWWLADDALVNTPEYPNEKEAREAAEEHLAQAAGAEAVARAIEKKREDRMGKVRIKNNQKDDDA